MATKSSRKKLSFFDFAPWNFIIFLLLGFFLIVLVASTLQNNAKDLGVKAGFACPDLQVPSDPGSCPGGWMVKNDGRCNVLVCNEMKATK